MTRFESPLCDLGPALNTFQDKHGPLDLGDVGNSDEFYLDLQDYTDGKFVVVDDRQPANILSALEQSPHITALWGFVGKDDLDMCVTVKGVPHMTPHPLHLQLCAGHKPNVRLNRELYYSFQSYETPRPGGD